MCCEKYITEENIASYSHTDCIKPVKSSETFSVLLKNQSGGIVPDPYPAIKGITLT